MTKLSDASKAVQKLPRRGGVIDLEPGVTDQTVVIDRPCTLTLGYGEYEYTGAECLFRVTAGDVAIRGAGQGNTGTSLLYRGNRPARLVEATLAGCFRLERVCLNLTSTDSHATCVLLTDPVGFHLEDIFCSHGHSPNSTTGVHVKVTKPLQVPPRGFGALRNFLYTGEGEVLPGSCALRLSGVPSGPLLAVELSGYGNVEGCETGIATECVTGLTLTGPWFFQGCNTAVNLGPHTTGTRLQQAWSNQCPTVVRIHDTCEDTVLSNLAWETPGMTALVGRGIRTALLCSSRGPWELIHTPLKVASLSVNR